MVHRWKKLR